jgi:hypothetical protein
LTIIVSFADDSKASRASFLITGLNNNVGSYFSVEEMVENINGFLLPFF